MHWSLLSCVIFVHYGGHGRNVFSSQKQLSKVIFFSLSDPTKFFGCELGAQTQIDLKNERYIVNGSHNAEKLQEILDSFIEKFVLCPSCENPETNLVWIIIVYVFTTVPTGGLQLPPFPVHSAGEPSGCRLASSVICTPTGPDSRMTRWSSSNRRMKNNIHNTFVALLKFEYAGVMNYLSFNWHCCFINFCMFYLI